MDRHESIPKWEIDALIEDIQNEHQPPTRRRREGHNRGDPKPGIIKLLGTLRTIYPILIHGRLSLSKENQNSSPIT